MIVLSYVFQALVIGSLCFLAACLTIGALGATRAAEGERESFAAGLEGRERGYSSAPDEPYIGQSGRTLISI